MNQILNVLNNLKIVFIYLLLAVLDFHCCVEFSLVVARGALFIAAHRLLILEASLVAEHRPGVH